MPVLDFLSFWLVVCFDCFLFLLIVCLFVLFLLVFEAIKKDREHFTAVLQALNSAIKTAIDAGKFREQAESEAAAERAWRRHEGPTFIGRDTVTANVSAVDDSKKLV